MNDNLTEIVFILDRSSSMGQIKTATMNGFNEFLSKQKHEPGEAIVTLVQFNHKYEVTHNGAPIRDIARLSEKTFRPSGMTALLDAVGETVSMVRDRIAVTADMYKPGKVIVVILTDGEENDSHTFNLNQIKEMIDKQRTESNWEFIFLGANQDSFKTAQMMSIPTGNTLNFVANSDSVTNTYSRLSDSVATYRTRGVGIRTDDLLSGIEDQDA